MTSWEQLQREHPHLKRFIEVGLQSAYQYYAKMDRTSSYIVAMCMCLSCDISRRADSSSVLNPKMRLSWIQGHWEDDYVTDAVEKIKEIVSANPTDYVKSAKLFSDGGVP